MPFQPEQITRAHVLQAAQKIKLEKIDLIPSTGYDVIIEEEAYPPKEIMRYAHEQMNGELVWNKSGGSPTNQILEKLGFSIQLKSGNDPLSQNSDNSQIWKLGCRWDSGKPSFYEYIKEQQIVIGVSDKEYDVNDLIIVTEGYQVKAIAKVLEMPKPGTSNPDLQSGFEKHEIEYSESVIFAEAEWYELSEEERFQYQLQQGISKVQDVEVQNRARKLWNERNASFWIFQGNPKVYDFEQAMKEGVLKDWTISAHKNRIKVNDRAIIWITGKRSGCYALVKVTSRPKEKKEASDNHLWESERSIPLSANIEILTNLVETPILKATVDNTPGLKNLKVGNQGTNFSATRNEYRILEKFADSTMKNKPKNLKAWPMNMILYGPPGTGKTYSTVDLAAKIIGFDTGSHEENLKAFKERVGKNIEFVTFHQSFTYEDFIEGIKPLTSDKQVTYEVQDGVFKRMAKRARKAGLSVQTQESQIKFERAFDELKNELAASEKDEVEIPMKRVSYHITGISSDYINFRKSSGGTGHDLKVDVLRKMYTGDLQYSQEGLGIYYHPLLEYLKEKSEEAPQTEEEKDEETHVLIIDEINRGNVAAIFGELITLIEEDKRAGGENPISITLPYSKAEFSVPSNLYLIGTMNTADRSVEALDTALRRRFSFMEVGPQPELLSPKKMIVSMLNMEAYGSLDWEQEPYNSHALSLYDFLGVEKHVVEPPLKKILEEPPEGEEIYWKEEHVSHLNSDAFKGIQLNQLLSTINNRIRILIDNDHTIGHAYFMGIATATNPWEALREVFHRNLLPLLQEYFFGDHGKIGLVLGSGFVREDKCTKGVGFANFEYPDMESLADRKLHKLVNVAEMKPEEFQQAVRDILPAKNTESDD